MLQKSFLHTIFIKLCIKKTGVVHFEVNEDKTSTFRTMTDFCTCGNVTPIEQPQIASLIKGHSSVEELCL